MLASRGFSLIEVLVAMSLSSILMIGTMRLLPSLQRAVLQQSQLNLMREDVWQLDDGHCLIVQWDANHNGKWDGATTSEPEQTGYRLRERNIEIQRGATQCTGKGWERLTDPGQFRIDDFTVAKIDRAGQKPLITISLSAAMAQDPTRSLNVLQQIVGYNQ